VNLSEDDPLDAAEGAISLEKEGKVARAVRTPERKIRLWYTRSGEINERLWLRGNIRNAIGVQRGRKKGPRGGEVVRKNLKGGFEGEVIYKRGKMWKLLVEFKFILN